MMKSSSRIHHGVAPGRLDVMGGISDYSGGLVLQMALPLETSVSFEPATDYRCKLVSYSADGLLQAEVDLQKFLRAGVADPEMACNYFVAEPHMRWAAYVLGPVLMLMIEKGIDFRGGSFEIRSEVPPGKGVASSAALEMAVVRAVADAFDLSFTGTQAAVLAQRAENRVAGAPCGLMDQLASAFGKPGWLLPITCQPDILHNPIQIPEQISIIGIDSGVRHSVEGSSYHDVRCAAFMGLSMLASAMGASAADLKHFLTSGDRSVLPFQGYLANISHDDFDQRLSRLLPEHLSGRDFLRSGGIALDTVTRIDEEAIYAVRVCTAHPVREQVRVKTFLNAVMHPVTSRSIATMGQMMLASNQGYTDCGLWSAATDAIVELAAEYPDLIAGARVSGGGSGGTVCLLATGESGRAAVAEVHIRLQEQTGKKLTLFA